MNQGELSKSRKMVSKVMDVLNDLKREHFSDAITHSYLLVDHLTQSVLKRLKAPIAIRYGRNDYEKIGFVLDYSLISELVFDNVSILKGMRDHVVHGSSYPSKLFARAAVITALEYYCELQPSQDYPFISDLDAFISAEPEFKFAQILVIAPSKLLTQEEIKEFEELVQANPGKATIIIAFPKDVDERASFRLTPQVKCTKDFLLALKAKSFIRGLSWERVDILADFPNLRQSQQLA